MISIPKTVLRVRNVFLTCVSTVQNANDKQALIDCADLIESAENDFDNKFYPCLIYTIPRNNIILGNVGKDEMKIVYNYRMVQNGMPGRQFYDTILSQAPFGKCPLCSARQADTLDHYLPKSKYPIYSVTPINLIPSCTPCNKGKLIDYPVSAESQTLHPYFDNVSHISWVRARIIHSNPISFEFYAHPPEDWDDILKERTYNHFESFKLNELFSSHANEELRGIRNQLINQFQINHQSLLDHLNESYHSRLELGINSWQSVMYYTLLNDDWFCNEGVLT